MPKLRDLTTNDDLAKAIGLTRVQLVYWAFLAPRDQLYTAFQIPKRSGGARDILAPRGPLKEIQRRIALLVSEAFSPRRPVHGYVQGRNVLTNATPHAAQRFLLNVDLKDFFPSINFGRVRGALLANPFNLNAEVATTIAQLACHENSLPQGAPTSPVLANVICIRLDNELTRLCRTYGVRYTRYADDLTFSTGRKCFPESLARALNPPFGSEARVGDALSTVIISNGFVVNEQKVRLLQRQHSQRVTGLVVNRFPNVRRQFVRRIRAMIHAWDTYGLEAAEMEFRTRYAARHRAPYRTQPSFRRSLKGKLSYLAMVRGEADSLYIRLAKQCRRLDASMFPQILDNDDLVEKAVWVVESDAGQGTGFFLAGVGFVTCAHVVEGDTSVYHPDDVSIVHAARIRQIDEYLDLAILEVPAVENPKVLALGDPERLNPHAKLLIAGYPNFGTNDGLYRAWGTLSLVKNRQKVRYLVPSVPIVAGNSGGPVLDEQYRVVGIAAKGAKSLSAAAEHEPDGYGAIFVSHLKALLAP